MTYSYGGQGEAEVPKNSRDYLLHQYGPRFSYGLQVCFNILVLAFGITAAVKGSGAIPSSNSSLILLQKLSSSKIHDGIRRALQAGEKKLEATTTAVRRVGADLRARMSEGGNMDQLSAAFPHGISLAFEAKGQAIDLWKKTNKKLDDIGVTGDIAVFMDDTRSRRSMLEVDSPMAPALEVGDKAKIEGWAQKIAPVFNDADGKLLREYRQLGETLQEIRATSPPDDKYVSRMEAALIQAESIDGEEDKKAQNIVDAALDSFIHAATQRMEEWEMAVKGTAQ
mmetsp:Transcript_30031/g.68182  ORF Transcript_30031/g.68182 Transcript_30031/m.68182 type:complete len:282 (-) Transcript_30031:52-897(-)